MALRLQHDDRDLPLRLLLILRKIRHYRRLRVIQSPPLITLGDPRKRSELAHARMCNHFHAHFRIRKNVVVPVRMCRLAALRGNDDVIVAVTRECQRIDSLLATLRALGGEQE